MEELNMTLDFYKPCTQGEVEAFFKECFEALGWTWELGNMEDIYNIPAVYQATGQFWCLYDGEKLVGTIALRTLSEGVGEMKRLYLLPAYQGKGLGGMLFDTALRYAKESGYQRIRADTEYDCFASRHLMNKNGFVEIGRYNDNPYAEIFLELTFTA